MKTAIQNKWDGGIAEDIRTFAVDESEKSLNFDIFTNPRKLIPFGDSIAETLSSGTISQIQLSDIETCFFGSAYSLIAGGYNASGDEKPAFYSKSAITGVSWANEEAGATASFIKNSLVVYKDKAYCLSYDGSGTYTLNKFVSASSVTAVGTISTSSTLRAKPFVHPEDNVLYIVIGTSITSWNDSAMVTTTTILPAGYECTSLCEYGTYLAITMRPLRGNGNSITYLWGRDATINTLQGQIPWGEGNVLIVENLNNSLFAVIQPFGTFGTVFTNKIIIRGYFGGAVEPIKSIVVESTVSVSTIKVKNSNKLYFGNTSADDCVYVFGKNKSGRYILAKDRYLFNGVTTYTGLAGLSMIGDIMWRLFVGTIAVYYLMRSMILDGGGETVTYNSTSIYKTTINPSMKVKDRSKIKQLKAVRVYYTGKSTGTINVKYAVDTATMTSILSETTTAIEDMKQTTMQDDTRAFSAGREIQFQIESIGGVEIKSLEYDYDTMNQ